MYYQNRAQAGRLLANELTQYANQDTVVVALSYGSVIVGAQVAMQLHANMLLHLVKNIYLPGENDPMAGLGSAGTFGYNSEYTQSELDEMTGEFRQYIEQKKFESFHEFNVLLGDDGEIDKDLVRHRVVIVVSDGFANAMSLDIAAEYFKSIAIKKLVVATPISSVPAVDRMHLVADEIVCLSVVDNFFGVNHYYENNTLPTMDDAFKIMRNISLTWKR